MLSLEDVTFQRRFLPLLLNLLLATTMLLHIYEM